MLSACERTRVSRASQSAVAARLTTGSAGALQIAIGLRPRHPVSATASQAGRLWENRRTTLHIPPLTVCRGAGSIPACLTGAKLMERAAHVERGGAGVESPLDASEERRVLWGSHITRRSLPNVIASLYA